MSELSWLLAVRIVRSLQELLEFEVMILWTSHSKVCGKGDLMVILYLYFTSVFCWRSCFYGGVARVWCVVREFGVGCAFLPEYAGLREAREVV